jgi:hypothetical protein
MEQMFHTNPYAGVRIVFRDVSTKLKNKIIKEKQNNSVVKTLFESKIEQPVKEKMKL